jgi:hypothetical protein
LLWIRSPISIMCYVLMCEQKNNTTIYDPICHRDIRPLELKCETPALAALKPSRTICVVAIGSCASPGSLSSTMYMVLSAQKLLLGPFEA